MTDGGKHVVFIHGLWLHASSWSPWVELFVDAGYEPVSPGWPNEPATVAEAREHPELVANIGIDEVTDHMAGIVDSLDGPPVIIGHSFGGLIVGLSPLQPSHCSKPPSPTSLSTPRQRSTRGTRHAVRSS